VVPPRAFAMSDQESAVSTEPMPFFLNGREASAIAPDETLVLEAELVRKCQDGNTRAFEEIVQLHTRRIFNFLNQMTRHRQDAEDLTQQTFVKAYHNLHRFDSRRPLINWLFTIARRTALNHFRSAKRWEELPESLACEKASPADCTEKSDETNTLWAQARHLLSRREFEILWLRFGEELSTEETARVAGLTQTHVKILVYRARQHLMKALKKS
jgi:RNA polymerase sigma-70 factor (ECF subfamily)